MMRYSARFGNAALLVAPPLCPIPVFIAIKDLTTSSAGGRKLRITSTTSGRKTVAANLAIRLGIHLVFLFTWHYAA